MAIILIEINQLEETEYTDKEYHKIADSGNKEDGGAIYGYVDKDKKIRREWIEIYKQELSVNSIKHIIAAANNLQEVSKNA